VKFIGNATIYILPKTATCSTRPDQTCIQLSLRWASSPALMWLEQTCIQFPLDARTSCCVIFPTTCVAIPLCHVSAWRQYCRGSTLEHKPALLIPLVRPVTIATAPTQAVSANPVFYLYLFGGVGMSTTWLWTQIVIKNRTRSIQLINTRVPNLLLRPTTLLSSLKKFLRWVYEETRVNLCVSYSHQ
jgi:hypothetical protein